VPPETRLFAGGGYAASQSRVLLVGGGHGSTALPDVWALDTSVPGAEHWERQADLPFGTGAGTLIDDRARGRLLVLVADAIGSRMFELHGTDAPTEVATDLEFGLWRTSVIEPDGEHALLLGGRRVDGSYQGVDRLELASLTATAYETSATAPPLMAGGSAHLTASGEIVVWPGWLRPDARGSLDILLLSLTTREWSSLHLDGEDAPRGVAESSVLGVRTFWGGVNGEGLTVGGPVWSFYDRWTQLDRTGSMPASRHSVGACDAALGCDLMGGVDASGPVDDGAWRADTDWIRLGTLPTPAPSTGAARVRPCGLVIGGTNASPTAAVASLACDTVGCTWEPRAALPSPLTWAAASFVDGGPTILFGGYSTVAGVSTVLALPTCMAASWTEVVPAGPSPAGRFGHTLTRGPVETTRQTFYMFGGSPASSSSLSFDDAWMLTYEAGSWRWEEIIPASGERPLGRRFHASWFDESQNRLLVFGGNASGSVVGDFWELRIRP
jgi:hypothetical protein